MITRYDKKQYLYKGQSYYLPYEHTICLSSRWNWFQKSTELPIRSLDELEELFYWSTDNNNCLVVNVPPDQTGRIREYEANAVIELGKRLGLKKGKPLPKNGQFVSAKVPVNASSTKQDAKVNYTALNITDGSLDSRWVAADTLATVDIQLDPKQKFNKISIFEYQDTKNLGDGFSNVRINRIQEYKIQVFNKGNWETIYLGAESMGDCKVIRLPRAYQTEKLRLNIIKASGIPSIYEINVIDK